MRIDQKKIDFIGKVVKDHIKDANIYIFGSRVDDSKKGGDTDVLVLADRKLTLSEKIKIKIIFNKKFGEQKLDIVSFTHKDNDSFKNLILSDAIKI